MFRFKNMSFQPENGILEIGSARKLLRPKTAQVLHLLIQNQQTLVSKEKLLETIWPDCHVGAGSLVQSVQELRRILGDNARNPQFIQTFPRRGYQWIMPLHLGEPSAKSAEVPQAREELLPVASVKSASWRWYPIGLVAIGMILVLAFVARQWRVKKASQEAILSLTAASQVAILPIVDETGDPDWEWLSSGIREMVEDHIAQDPNVGLMSNIKIFEMLTQLRLSTFPLNDAQAQAFMEKANVQILLQSQIRYHDNQLTFHYRISRGSAPPETGEIPFSNPAILTEQILLQLSSSSFEPATSELFSEIEAANRDYLRGKNALETKGAPLAKRYFEAALLHDPNFEACRLSLARTFYLMGDIAQAESLYQQVLQAAISQNRTTNQVRAMQGLAGIDWHLGRYQLSNSRLEQSLEICRQTDQRELEARSLRTLAWHHIHYGYWEKHDAYERQAHQLSADFSDEEKIADELYYLGSSDSPGQDFEKSRLLLLMAMEYYQKANKPYDLSFTYLAIARNRATPVEEQLAFLKKAEGIFEEMGYHLMIPGVWEAMAIAHAQALQPQKFKSYILKSHRSHEKLGLKDGLANTQFLMGAAEIMVGLAQEDEPLDHYLTKAEAWLDLCHDFYKDQKVVSRQASESLLRGMIALERNQLSVSTNYFSTAAGLFEHLAYPEGIAVSFVAKADLALKQKHWQEALDWLTKAEAIYPQRPGLWQPFAIYAHLQLGQLDTASQIAEAHLTVAKTAAQPGAHRWLKHCSEVRAGQKREAPLPPNLLAAYFQAY